MEHCYIVIKEWCEEYDECRFGYPQIWTSENVVVCRTQEDAEKLVKQFEQDDVDRFMDWLDECKEYMTCGLTDVKDYDDPDRPDFYQIQEVPYHTDAG